MFMFNFMKYRLFRCGLIYSVLLVTIFLVEGCSTNSKAGSKIQLEAIGAPKLVLDNSSYDFGKIHPNSTNKAIFKFANIGNEPLIIKDIQKCCGAVVSLDKEELNPGENGVLTVQYQAGNEARVLMRQVGFTTNEPNNPVVTLTIMGQINDTLEYYPKTFKVASFSNYSEYPKITIKSLDETPFSIRGFKATQQLLFLEYDSDYKATEFIIKPKINKEKIKDFSGTGGAISIELDHPDYEAIELNFNITPSLEAVPAQILVYNSKENEPIQKTIEIQVNEAIGKGNVSAQIDSVVSENGCQVSLLKSTSIDKGYKLDLEIASADHGSKTFLKDQIIINLKDGRQIKVPLRILN